MSRPYHEKWGDMRANCDEALKLLGMLPSAVSTAQDDPGFVDDVIRDLSNNLCCLDASIGDEKPATVKDLQSNPRTGKDGKTNWDEISRAQIERAKLQGPGMHLYPGQVELITRLFHEATDAGCELLTVLTDDDQSERAHRSEGYLESLAKRVVQAMWNIRWEMNIDSPQLVDDESEAP